MSKGKSIERAKSGRDVLGAQAYRTEVFDSGGDVDCGTLASIGGRDGQKDEPEEATCYFGKMGESVAE